MCCTAAGEMGKGRGSGIGIGGRSWSGKEETDIDNKGRGGGGREQRGREEAGTDEGHGRDLFEVKRPHAPPHEVIEPVKVKPQSPEGHIDVCK